MPCCIACNSVNTPERLWYGRSAWRFILAPLAGLFCLLVAIRRRCYRLGLKRPRRLPVPVIVVGNITLGGTGKTPLVIWLAGWLRQRGYRPGIVARGYGGQARHWPQQVRPDSDPAMVGDEPVLIARRSGCPMAVAPDRVAAARALLEHSDCDVIISDDGLQHYALGRDIELAVLDGVRRLGNGWCLPAGPLREPASRLQSVDAVITQGVAGRGEFRMTLVLGDAINLLDGGVKPLGEFPDDSLALAGIGNPARFFAALKQAAGLASLETRAFPDHHAYTEADSALLPDERPVLMTEKDAVKLQRFARKNFWFVPAHAELDSQLPQRLDKLLRDCVKHLESHDG